MPTSQIIEVAIGLVFVYYVLGSVVSFVTQMLLESAETRGSTLEDHLKRIAGDKTIDLVNLPQMKALRPIRYTSWLGVFGAKTEPKKMEKIPVNTLVDAFFDLTGITGREKIDATQLTSAISQLPESEGKQAMLKWINQGVTSINDLRARANDYFSGVLNQAAATFRSHARSIVIIFSVILVFALGTDTIQIARDLWGNAGLRAAANAEATAMAQTDSAAGLSELIQALSDTTMRITWLQTSDTFPKAADTADWAGFVALKFIGLSITAWATSQGSSFWYDMLKKLTGRTTSPVEEGKG